MSKRDEAVAAVVAAARVMANDGCGFSCHGWSNSNAIGRAVRTLDAIEAEPVAPLVLKVDNKRWDAHRVGFPVRAIDELGMIWDPVDAGVLDRESMLAWLRSRDGANPWMESVVLRLLGYDDDNG